MSNHTPGPWRQHSEHPDRIIVNGSCVYQVRDMTTNTLSGFGPPNSGDVALMAAAPELYWAARCALADLEGFVADAGTDMHSVETTIKELVQAITKAERKGD